MTCYFGVDLHKTQFTVHTRTENRVKSMAASLIVNNLYVELIEQAKVEDNRYLYF